MSDLKTSICPNCEAVGSVAITPVEGSRKETWLCVECGATGFVDDKVRPYDPDAPSTGTSQS